MKVEEGSNANLDTTAGATESTTGTIGRALQLLGVLADAPGSVTVKHVAEAMGLAPSTAHRLLNLLKKDGFVESSAESRQYAIGPAFYRVSARVMGSVSKTSIAQPVIDELAVEFDETVLFGLYLPAERALSFAGRADGQQRLTYHVDMHRPLSLVWGASGKAILAFLDADVVRSVIAAEGPSPATGAPAPATEALIAALAKVREQGFAISENEKLPDARGIAAPVFGPAGVVGCICLTSPTVRMPHASIDGIVRSVVASAELLSQHFGASRP